MSANETLNLVKEKKSLQFQVNYYNWFNQNEPSSVMIRGTDINKVNASEKMINPLTCSQKHSTAPSPAPKERVHEEPDGEIQIE